MTWHVELKQWSTKTSKRLADKKNKKGAEINQFSVVSSYTNTDVLTATSLGQLVKTAEDKEFWHYYTEIVKFYPLGTTRLCWRNARRTKKLKDRLLAARKSLIQHKHKLKSSKEQKENCFSKISRPRTYKGKLNVLWLKLYFMTLKPTLTMTCNFSET